MIPPKEKAIEIFNSMKGFRVKHSHSKKCAKIKVEGIISEYENEIIPSCYDFDVPAWEENRDYYKEVLVELEKL